MAVLELASPFQSGTFSYGDSTIEWRTLLNTPCYGFNGPNACYSSTCKHDGSKSKLQQSAPVATTTKSITEQQQLINQRSSLKSSELSVKFNWRTVSGSCSSSDSNYASDELVLADVTATDNQTTKISSTEQMNVYVCSNGSSPNFNE